MARLRTIAKYRSRVQYRTRCRACRLGDRDAIFCAFLSGKYTSVSTGLDLGVHWSFDTVRGFESRTICVALSLKKLARVDEIRTCRPRRLSRRHSTLPDATYRLSSANISGEFSLSEATDNERRGCGQTRRRSPPMGARCRGPSPRQRVTGTFA